MATGQRAYGCELVLGLDMYEAEALVIVLGRVAGTGWVRKKADAVLRALQEAGVPGNTVVPSVPGSIRFVD